MPGKFLNEARFGEIRSAIDAGVPHILEARDHLMDRAEEALTQPRLSVRDNGGSPFFRQDAAYIPGQDGVRNAQANHESGKLAGRFSATVLDLAIAYRLTGESRFADKALELIHCWCINQNTRMFPGGFVQDAFTPGAQYGGDIILFACFNNAFLAMYLLDDYPGWDIYCQAAVKKWVRDMVEPQRKLMFFDGCDMYNNWEDARLLYLGTGGLALGDLDLLIYVFERWRTIIPMKMTDEGQLPRETMRTRSMHYTLFALSSTSLIAEVAAAYGYDLYDYSIDGRCLRKALDYATRYLLDMDEWPFEMIEPLEEELDSSSLALFEMVYGHWRDDRYLQVIDRYGGRPVKKSHATLLYAKA
ncbi:MAG: alginate lyase family protein [Gemmatimonadetes bacterium]|jgi:hypothetical protein|nr:alginate lyase family protein [Gemmatimonadota bacterium]